jgi:hypothetical protein
MRRFRFWENFFQPWILMSTSGFERLDRLSLPRRAMPHAIAQDNRKHRNERECCAVSRQLAAVTFARNWQ